MHNRPIIDGFGIAIAVSNQKAVRSRLFDPPGFFERPGIDRHGPLRSLEYSSNMAAPRPFDPPN